MDTIIHLLSMACLAGLSLYVLQLLVNQYREVRLADRVADAERELLRERVGLLMDQRKFEREKTELSWNGYRKFTLKKKIAECRDVCSFYLEPHDGKPLPPFQPGQYLTFRLNVAGSNKPVIRCYSLSDSPNHPEHYRVTIKRIGPPPDKPDMPPGRGSGFFHDQLREGDIVDVAAPRGGFCVDMTTDTPVVLIGGGVGITPVLSMLNAIMEKGSRREVWLFFGARNGTEHIQREHLQRLAAEHRNLRLHVCYSNPTPDNQLGRDHHHAERVSVELMKKLLPSSNYEFYICGPPPMMDTITRDLKAWGVPEEKVNFEAFGAATIKTTAAPAPAAAPTGLTIKFGRAGKSCAWDPALGSLLDFAEKNGVRIDSGCRAGNCGTCLTAVKSGEFSYLHEPGAKPEAGSCLTCIAVPKSDLTLDA